MSLPVVEVLGDSLDMNAWMPFISLLSFSNFYLQPAHTLFYLFLTFCFTSVDLVIFSALTIYFYTLSSAIHKKCTQNVCTLVLKALQTAQPLLPHFVSLTNFCLPTSGYPVSLLVFSKWHRDMWKVIQPSRSTPEPM